MTIGYKSNRKTSRNWACSITIFDCREYILSIQLARNLEVLKAEDEDEEPEEQKLLVSGTPKAVECLGWLTVHGMVYDVHGIFLQSKRIHCMGCLFVTGRKVTPMWPCRVFACIWRVVRDCCLVFSCVDVICMRNSSTENVPYSLCCSLFAPNVAWSPATSDHGLKPWFSFNVSSWSSNFEAKSSWIGHDYKLTILEQIVPTHSQLVCTKCGCASPFLTGV